jgi:hypothetical protein
VTNLHVFDHTEPHIGIETMAGKENIARQISEKVRNKTHVHMNFFLRMTDTMTSQDIDLSPWDILYN